MITIASQLKRDKILQNAMRALKNRILPVLAFANRIQSEPLEGTDTINVPYFPLASGATKDFVAGTGYVVGLNQSVGYKPVTINKRKYRDVYFTSVEWNRQPHLKVEKLVEMEAEKLADDVLADIWSVVTAANYPGTSGTNMLPAMAASAFDFDDLATLRRFCGEANWPSVGRSVILDGTFHEYLTRDSRFGMQNTGSNEAAREGRVSRALGFDVLEVPLLPPNGAEKVAGAAVYQSAILVGFAPVTPHPTLRKTVVDYTIVTDPDTGLALEYRAWGNPNMDAVTETIEVNYGFAVGEAAALKRIVTP